jgi:hypothetical protein
MIPNIYRYQVDLSGQSNDNYVTGEIHAIGTQPVRAIAPTGGIFYGASMALVDAFTQKELTPTQYSFQFLDTPSSIEAGQEVWGVVLIIDPSVGPNVSLSYQAFGGANAQVNTTMTQEVAALALDARGISFTNITDPPSTYTPVPHMHWVGDTYDWDYVVSALELCLNAMALAEAASYDTTLVYVDQQAGLRTQDITTFANALQQHIQNYQNPHQVTLAQVDVYASAQVDTLIANEATARVSADASVNASIQTHATNYLNPHADTADSIGGYSITETNANLAAVVASVNARIASDNLAMTSHIANHNNPHVLTLVQLNAESTSVITAAITAALTPISTQMASDLSSMNVHIANRSNPHQTTIAQIGAWDSGDIQAYSNAIAAHEANYNNPHQVSAAQAGTWTAAQINSVISGGFAVPINNALNAQANTINAHTGNFSNPHNTNPYTIGGWEYGDWLNQLNSQKNALSYH